MSTPNGASDAPLTGAAAYDAHLARVAQRNEQARKTAHQEREKREKAQDQARRKAESVQDARMPRAGGRRV